MVALNRLNFSRGLELSRRILLEVVVTEALILTESRTDSPTEKALFLPSLVEPSGTVLSDLDLWTSLNRSWVNELWPLAESSLAFRGWIPTLL